MWLPTVSVEVSQSANDTPVEGWSGTFEQREVLPASKSSVPVGTPEGPLRNAVKVTL